MSIARRFVKPALLGLALAGLVATGPRAFAQETVTLAQPAAVADGDLQPGLAALYFYEDFRDIDKMPTKPEALAKGVKGEKPILKVEGKSREGELFNSGSNSLYGIHMTGFIKFDKPGDWVMGAISNDGVRVKVADQVVADDPTVHADRPTQPVVVKVPAAGWYPLQIQYFQRKYTAQLQLLWQAPDGAAMAVVPGEALSHKKS